MNREPVHRAVAFRPPREVSKALTRARALVAWRLTHHHLNQLCRARTFVRSV